MKIYHNQLTATLNKAFIPIWLIFGDEPWQKNNSLAVIKSHAQQQGFTEVIRFTSDNKFDWQQLIDEYQSMSLFASQRIIEVEFTSVKIGDSGHKTLVSLSEVLAKNSHLQDVIFIFHGPKLDAPSANRKWFKSLTQQGCYLPLYDIDAKALPQWLQNQARTLNVNLEPELRSLLLELFEGNLLALEQELQKLQLLFGTQLIRLSDAEQLVIKQAKFNPFQVIDALLIGDCKKCITILDQLKQEGTAATQLIWIFHKEINQLHIMLDKMAQGVKLPEIYKQYRIWDKRKPLYQHALTHISIENSKQALSRLAQIDLISKTSGEFDAFILLADLCVTLYHGDITKHFSLNYEYN